MLPCPQAVQHAPNAWLGFRARGRRHAPVLDSKGEEGRALVGREQWVAAKAAADERLPARISG